MAHHLREELLAVSDAFAAAALDHTQWLPALQKLADLTGSSRAQLIGIGADSHTPFNYITGFAPDQLAAYANAAGYSPIVNPRVAASLVASPMTVVSEADYEAVLPKLASAAAIELNHAFGIPFGCQTSLMRDAEGQIGLAVLRTEREGRTGARARALFAAAALSARMAARTQLALDGEAAALVAGAFEAVRAAAFICSRAGRLIARTPAADALLTAGRLRLSDGSLAAPGVRDGVALTAAIAACRGGYAVPAPRSVVISPASPDELPLVLDVAPLPRRVQGFGMGAEVLVLVRGIGAARGQEKAILRTAYDLTPAEAEVAMMLFAGRDRRDIAFRRGTSEATVHVQLRAIFLKTGVRREADLVARVSTLLS